ncbi:MAG: MoaD/ThiS family protein [Paracoccaceae bacterium]|jgi:sulfur-carrier protein|nr:MAG: thiamine biosynthesis protein ThiS [Rhodobacter sp. BACL10 MAG-120910-bin24]KRP23028.1 MAG: thiamine biosynthesis protein ThiS [Rhodobacter sp. BACL10 MAG-120419-bin15]MDA0354337.1 MoaD/ThiS family protein [Pseudomonadota bacterium]MDO7567641.1 MoaD/ThiS family protein [Paracoccaceae bacterium]HAG26299.1 molybdopterin synthase sulfur carrier subunit [Rhodobacter sp.]
MVAVTLWGTMRQYANDQEKVEVQAATFKELCDALIRDYPGMQPQIERGVSLAIDGRIYKEAWFTPISADSEVVLMPFMQGG